MYAYASPQGLSSPTSAAAAAAAAVHHHHHPHVAAAAAYHHHHPHMVAPHPHHPYSSAASSPSTVTALGSPSVVGSGGIGGNSGGYLTSPTGSSIQLLGGSPNHNGGHSLIGLQSGASGSPGNSHLGLQDHQSAMLAGASGVGMGAPTYDGGVEMATEMKKRR